MIGIMIKCTFLGHPTVFDQGLSDKLDAAVTKVMWGNDEAEFLFFENGAFYHLCLAAVLKAQRRFPNKQIRITLVWKPGENPKLNPIPMCMIDTLLRAPQFPSPKRVHDFTLNYRQTVQWVLAQCSHLISYLYPLADKGEMHHYRYAKRKKLTILDVTDPATADYMEDHLKTRSAREQFVAKGRMDGRTFKEIGAELGVTASMIQQNFRTTSRAMIHSTADRLREQTAGETIACGVFRLGLVNPQRMIMFKQVASFLITQYRVTEFNVTAEVSSSKYMSVLEQVVKSHKDVKLSVITHYSEAVAEDWFQKKLSDHKAFCDSVENINPTATRIPRTQTLQTIHWMMETTDYCISNLMDNTLRRNIENYARKLHGVRLVDIGRDTVLQVRCDE